ncbi:hypothetical protein BGX34_001264 [Mortierella sp. NVP85]|nr:hypothetical protein BGX34_001264 [Mortierella sp. NVP85]
MFDSTVPSGGPSTPQQFLNLANLYLEQAFSASDPGIALELCRNAKDSLSKAKKTVKKSHNQIVVEGITYAYIDLRKFLERCGHSNGAKAIFKKAEKLGRNISNLDQPTNNYRPSMIAQTLGGASHSAAGGSRYVGSAGSFYIHQQQTNRIPAHIFAKNIGPPSTNELKLPEPDQRLNNTQQLVCCLSLLKAAQLPDIIFKPIAIDWLQTVQNDTDEKERLNDMALDIIRAFKMEKIKDTKTVTEVACLAPILNKDAFHDLLREFYSGIEHSGPLNIPQLEGLAQLIQDADLGHLSADDLVKILGLLSSRLMDTHPQSSQHMYQLTMAVSHVLDAMADTKVTDLDREKLHEPLSSYLGGEAFQEHPRLSSRRTVE